MEPTPPQFVGPPCGQYGSHTFYRGFRYTTKQARSREISLGEFFFVRISAEEDPCIGELQLLCSNRNNDQHLTALRLYFLPEQTPDGRLSHHGEDEVLVASDRVVLKLEDLISWITDEVEWNHGIIAPYVKSDVKIATAVVKKEEAVEPQNDSNNNDTSSAPPGNSENENAEEVEGEGKKTVDIKDENIKETNQDPEDEDRTKVLVLSYQSYCRYRTILKRIDGGDIGQWLQNSLVIALGGIAPTSPKTHVLFCRDNFEHDELAHHELNCEYLAPTIKGKRRKRKTKNTRSISPESNTSDECKAIIEIKSNQKTNGLKQPPVKNEQEFLQRLFKFMKKRNTPIHRVPHLGFKQIDLYVFYSFAQKLGGYDKITNKKLWKHVYDELGGNPGSTSAATCTRRHYERLLLPFERFMDGILYKPAQRGKKSQKKKPPQEDGEEDSKEDIANGTSVKNEPNHGISAEAEDAYTFTDSNHENSNSKDSNSNEFNSACDEQALTNEPPFSDEDSKTVWSIQNPPDNKDEASQDKDDSKPIKPLIIQKGQSETFAEKDRKWDEIRRKNAAARKWVRQSRSARGCKTPVPDIPSFKQEKHNNGEIQLEENDSSSMKVKSEVIDLTPDEPVVSAIHQDKMTVDSKTDISVPPGNLNMTKPLPPVNPETLNGKTKLENHTQKRRHILAKETPSHLSSDKKTTSAVMKIENDKHTKTWYGYPTNTDHTSYQLSSHPRLDTYPSGLIKTHMPLAHKLGTRTEHDVARDYQIHTGRQSVGSASVSSVVSVEASVGDEKPLVPQRRPSVIQHTEYAATSPSPSLSPKQAGNDACRNTSPKDNVQSVPFSHSKMNLLPTQLSYSMTGKVAEWLTKGVHEVVACKTPSTAVEKCVELHDKVMMPSSCKMPGAVGTGKVPVNNVKSKQNNATNSHKSPRSKYSSSHRHRNSEGVVNGTYTAGPRNEGRISAAHQKMVHPVPSTFSVMTNPTSAPKYQHTTNQKSAKTEYYSNGPYYNQPKRYKVNNMVPIMMTPVNSCTSLSPFARQQKYCTPPLSDIPKTTTTSTHNDYESTVLDLSIKKKPAHSAPTRTVAPPVSISPVPEEGVCLDLSIKKKPNNVATDNGIENITPPLPLSPNPSSQPVSYMHSSLKPLPTLIALQDLANEEAARRSYTSSSNSRLPPIMTNAVTAPVSGPPLVMPPTMFPGNAHGKLPPGLVNTLPSVAYSKDMAKNLYIPNNTRHSQFPPYVIPPFFPSNWTSVVNASPTNAKQTNNSQTSPMTYKGMVNHSVFPKDYPYNVKSQFHPVLCKDSGHYPSNDNK